jgi:hypothetical protein
MIHSFETRFPRQLMSREKVLERHILARGPTDLDDLLDLRVGQTLAVLGALDDLSAGGLWCSWSDKEVETGYSDFQSNNLLCADGAFYTRSDGCGSDIEHAVCRA